MYSQSFLAKELFACSTQSERRDSGICKSDFIMAIEKEIGDTIYDGSYRFNIKKQNGLYLNGYKKGDFAYLCQNLVLRKLYNNIKSVYSVQQADRNVIVKQIKMLLSEDIDIRIIRLDVKHFYESINRGRIIKGFFEDSRLNFQSLRLLKTLFDDPVVAEGEGLPRGLGISAAMSEIYMKPFDLEIKRLEGVYYYARYVDDIIIFCNSERNRKQVWECAEKALAELGLELNRDKSYTWDPGLRGCRMTYLGYTFEKIGKELLVTISKKKQNVIKTRLTRSFVRYSKDRDFSLLKMRVKFLTGNFTLYKADTLTPIKVGLYFNYKLANSFDSLTVLDEFYQRLLHCRTGRLGSKIRLTKGQVCDLEKYSFRFGYEKHVNHHFSVDQMAKIVNCWI